MSNNNKMKGLLKGLRYISQIFDNEKEPEMQIGYPTDVKHVAHIGWDGPSVNSPSWMNEFKSPAFASAPLNHNGDVSNGGSSVKWANEVVPNSPARDLPELPRSSRRQQTAPGGSGASGVAESPTREKSEKTRQRRSSKHSSRDSTDSPRQSRRSSDSNLGVESPERKVESPSRNLPEIPKKSRRKKSKESNSTNNGGGGGGSSRSRLKAQAYSQADQFMAPYSDPGPGPGPGPGLVSKSKDSDLNRQKPIFDEAEEIKGLIT
ncbi:CRIB domain containing protein [Parasponia andersonii]|uniref:CRIB domain containing protein n=1 Tax=Parasponia andersonii TaxID=3476 RepID=A0A2P5ADZ9_PARAD|nr:CRIB domain containing protein [Parasponia andersonii]